jgi:hypothetical protein
MPKTGIANLPLHGGKAPKWLFDRMVKLAEGIIELTVHEHGKDEFLRRVSNPFWFQALSCTLGFDWHSSGTTTVTCGAIKEAVKPLELGLAVAGGKGRVSRRTPMEIEELSKSFNFSDYRRDELIYSSRMSAKIDNTAIQDQHQLYHHNFLFTEEGKWAVIQQGLDINNRYARRYHWLSENVDDFVVEPHDAILSDLHLDSVLDMTSKNSENAKKISVDLVNDNPRKIHNLVASPRPSFQKSIDEWIKNNDTGENNIKVLTMPTKINWNRLRDAYEVQPKNFEELISIKGIGPSTVRALALISELVYGEAPCWKDPVKFSFTVGGKDGVPYPVDRKTMDKSIEILKQGVTESKIGNQEKLKALKRLRKFVPSDI